MVKLGELSARYGKKCSEESKRKMSEAKKGITPWNKDKKENLSEEKRKKMSDRMKSIPPLRKGAKHTPETLQKLSEAIKGRIWVTNSIDSKFVFIDEIPDGYKKGRIMKNMRGIK